METELKFPGGALMREPASPLWNKVLQTSLSFADVCSGAGVRSVSFCSGVLVAFLAFRLPVIASHAWNYKGIATCPSLTELSGDLKKDVVLVCILV